MSAGLRKRVGDGRKDRWRWRVAGRRSAAGSRRPGVAAGQPVGQAPGWGAEAGHGRWDPSAGAVRDQEDDQRRGRASSTMRRPPLAHARNRPQ
jgi:hypothetical protein